MRTHIHLNLTQEQRWKLAQAKLKYKKMRELKWHKEHDDELTKSIKKIIKRKD